MPRKDQLLRILAALDGHFAASDCSPADADRWRELKRHIVRMKNGLDLARFELESGLSCKALKRVLFGLGETPHQPVCAPR
jgi:hypothetical protein